MWMRLSSRSPYDRFSSELESIMIICMIELGQVHNVFHKLLESESYLWVSEVSGRPRCDEVEIDRKSVV